MKYRRLGRSGLKVSEISLGSWLTYGKSVEDDTATKTIHKAYELGINFFDSANVYERGQGEIVMAKRLKNSRGNLMLLQRKPFGRRVMGQMIADYPASMSTSSCIIA